MLKNEFGDSQIGVIGLGNIGLPLAIELGKKYLTIGFDIDEERVYYLKQGINTRETNSPSFIIPTKLSFSTNVKTLDDCNIYIVTVSTSIYSDGTPNLFYLLSATQSVATFLKKDDLVIYESTVFPGCTEDICVPILEQYSGLIFNTDFFVGYSPERINTADSVHTLINTIKITAGSDIATAQRVDLLYKSIIEAGTYPVASIKIAEAAKLLENAQRDINIAFMNNVADILSSHDIRFDEVWNASSTKWNFLKFQPGLVGGECLPLATHYLNYLSDKKENTLSIARKVNDALPQRLAQLVVTKLRETFPEVSNFSVLILGIAYKPNTSSIQGSLVPSLVDALRAYQLNPVIYDPLVEPSEVYNNIGNKYHFIIKATNHRLFASLDYKVISYPDCLIFDVNCFCFI